MNRFPDVDARVQRLATQGMHKFAEYQRTGQPAELDRAIAAFPDATIVCPDDDPNRTAILANLGLFLHTRYQRTGQGPDLGAAIDAAPQAVHISPPDHIRRAEFLFNYGEALATRYERTGSRADIDAAVERTGDQADLDAALSSWQQASQVSASPPGMRLAAARNWASAAADNARTSEAADGYAVALTVLPIHAAGHHRRLRTAAGAGANCVPARVVSSYTPTLTALVRARQASGPAGLPSRQRDLAFLSACETATGSVRHLDEAIHLAAALQFLGYQHIVATTWTIADAPAPRVADRVYAGLSQPGGPDPGLCARALHTAVESLRQDDPTDPVRWAPYVHFGA